MQQKILERDVLKACLEFLQWKGIFAWRQNQGAIPTQSGQFRRFVGLRGVSDILGVLPGGTILCCEVKRPGGKLSSFQKEFQKQVAELGGIACTVHSVEELEADLKEAGVL